MLPNKPAILIEIIFQHNVSV